MKYIVMIYHDAELWNALKEDEQQALMREGGQRWEAAIASGEAILGEPLGSPASANIVRTRNGITEVTDGPYAESKEQLVGFMLLEVASRERAVELAKTWPDAAVGSLVVRQLGDFNANTLDA
ncbi:MAG: YciI family protein [Thermomicrobiales bacterium]